MELSVPRGTQDLLPPRSESMFRAYEEAHKLAQRFGFGYVETPTFEHTELFSRTAGESSDVVSKEMYSFFDKGDRSLTLRPEGTAGVMRAYLDRRHQVPKPFKAYYLETFFRHNRPQAGRLREFRQFGAEVIDEASSVADVEVIMLAHTYIDRSVPFPVTLRLNSIGDEVCRPAYRERLRSYFAPYADELDFDCQSRLQTNPLRIFDCKVDGRKEFVLQAPSIAEYLCDPCRDHFSEVKGHLTRLNVSFELDERLVRGLDYYTRTAFEFETTSLARGQATLCGGGRYDGLAKQLGGRDTPGVGFGLGLDRLLLASEDSPGLMKGKFNRPRCFLAHADDAGWEMSKTLLFDLRLNRVRAVAPYSRRSLRKQLASATKLHATYAAILGAQGLASGLVTVKLLSDGREIDIAVKDLAQWLLSPNWKYTLGVDR